ncbi:MAG: response regulator transcription factor [Proteobacteria bacterium]|nr:response regulator transcription factor [Pseudomonadota bacterium]
MKHRVLVVEDDPGILRGLLDLFTFHGYEAAGEEDGEAGLSRALAEPFDLAVLDVMLPSLDGFSICRELRAKKPAAAILMLTAKGSEDDVVEGFSSGADDYVAKPFSLRELMVRVEALLRRTGKSVGGGTLTLGGVEFDGTRLTARAGERATDITRREMDILCYLSRAEGRIVSRGELLTQVWQYQDAGVETRTVDIHMQKLKKKILTLTNGEPLFRTVRGEGWVLDLP